MEKIRTLFISDVHLGSKKSQPDKLLQVFKKYDFDKLIIIGDFIDLLSLRKRFYWTTDHSTVIQKVLKMSRKNIEVCYILGNHDYYLRELIKEGNIYIGNIFLCNELIHETVKGEKIYLCHGDQFDGFIRLHPFLYMLGDKAYDFSMFINKIYNYFRKLFGLNYWSLSAFLKSKVKNAIKYLNDFKAISISEIEKHNCNSIMIGHIHSPSFEKIQNFTYYNTGDFCESCSYIVETTKGIVEVRKIDQH